MASPAIRMIEEPTFAVIETTRGSRLKITEKPLEVYLIAYSVYLLERAANCL